MRIDRILGVILSILIVSFVALKYFNSETNEDNPFELIGDNGYMSGNNLNLEEKRLSENEDITEIIEFTNTYNYPVEIKGNDITITCTGSGSTKDEDELLVKSNYKIKAKFSEEKNGKLYDSLTVPKKTKIYIHVISEYEGALPENQVSCSYNLNIATS